MDLIDVNWRAYATWQYALETVAYPGGCVSSYNELEHDLAHIKAAISLLEQTRSYFSVRSPVCDPAYWKAWLRAALHRAVCDDGVEQQIERLLGRLDHLEAELDGVHYVAPRRVTDYPPPRQSA
jgi:hypothetical protein